MIACVAGARKGKGEKKSRTRAREAVSWGERGGGGKRKFPSPSLRVFRARPIFPSPFPFLAPATQARYMTVHAATRRRLLEA